MNGRPVIVRDDKSKMGVPSVVVIRETELSDLTDIFRIRNDPAVRPNQYGVRSDDSIEVWSEHLVGQQSGPVTFSCATILVGDEVVGHVTSHHFRFNGESLAQCGWNLDPRFWGRGLMYHALTSRFSQFFRDGETDRVMADCFHRNHRCKRLMSKLGFVPVKITLRQRFEIAMQTSSCRWIDRYRLDADSFSRRSED